MHSFFLLIAVIVSGIVAAVLVLTGVAIAVYTGQVADPALPDYVGVVIALGGMAGFAVPLWLWDVFQKSRTQKR